MATASPRCRCGRAVAQTRDHRDRIAPPLTSTVSWTVLYRFFNGHGRGGSTETLLVSQPGPCALTGPELVGIMLPLHRPDRVRLGDCKGNGAVPLIRPDERTSEQ